MTRRIPLPEFCVQAVLPYEELLWRRRSVRVFAPRPLTLQHCACQYGERAARYVALEAGHVAQNVCVECTALGQGTAPIGAFDDDAVRRVLRLPAGLDPLYLLPVGHPT